ncbi:MAG: DUF222 domain-containing protein [bacterium]|nr:DUF222 domain-containing protein [bacterium]
MEHEQLFADNWGGGKGGRPSTGPASVPAGCDAGGRMADLIDHLDRFVVEESSRRHPEEALGLLGRFQTRLSSHMCDLTRQATVANPDTDPVGVLKDKSRLSGRDAKRMAKVAERLPALPQVADALSEGEITVDYAKALVDAADRVGSEAVESDPGLLEEATRSGPDRFARTARDWSNRKLIEAGVDTLERQRRAREAKLWVDRQSGMGMLFAKLPAHQFAHLQQAADAHYLELWRRDSGGGRDPDRVRTLAQRMADVVVELLTNLDAVTGEILDGNAGPRVKASTQVVVVAEQGVVDGTDPGGSCEIIGVGPVPRDIFRTLSADTQLAAMIYDRQGRPLWLGRNQRLANAAQRLAVAVRDGGCFQCGTPMHRCELHHIQEWHRDGGHTDIDNLVAVCRRHHRQLEVRDLVVQRKPGGGYQAVPRDGPPC